MRVIDISARRFSEIAHVNRRTMQRALDGEESVKESTYDQIEMWLERLEAEAALHGGIPDEPSEPAEENGPRLVEIELEGVYGIARAVVKGPVDDPDAVARAATELMRRLREERERDGQ